MARPARVSFADALYGVIVAGGAAALGVALVPFARFLPDAPREFWLLAVIALVTEIRPFTIPHAGQQPTRVTVSLCITFAMLLIWGGAQAIVVQAVAFTIAAARQRLSLRDWSLTAARLIWAFAAAWLTVRLMHGSPFAIGIGITRFDVLAALVPAMVWFATNFALLALILMANGRPLQLRGATPTLRYEMVGTAVLLAASPVLISAPTGWSIVLLAVPLLGLNQVSRLLTDQELQLRRDAVTGLQNSRGLSARALDLADVDRPSGERRTPGSWYALVLVNLAGLTYVTTNLGRAVENRVLAEVGRRLRELARTSPAVTDRDIGRLPESDFAVLVPRADQATANNLAALIGTALVPPIEVDGLPFALEPAIGVALAPRDGPDISTMVRNAERAALEAKAQGLTVRAFRSTADSEAARRLALLSDLRAAVQEPDRAEELSLLFQPQVTIDTGHVVGAEALIRWRHPAQGLLDTGTVLETAEPSGVMHLLTQRILDDVLDQIAAWLGAGLELRVSVNVSARDLVAHRFADQVRSQLERHGVAPRFLDLEVTESALVADSPRLAEAASQLTALGVGLSLDDFGTGYASLRQLRRLPLSEVKIDRSYVRGMVNNAADRAVVTAICQLGRALHLRVVAEGVEDQATVDLLAAEPGVIGQGWYYARPMPAEAVLAWVRDRSVPSGGGRPGRDASTRPAAS